MIATLSHSTLDIFDRDNCGLAKASGLISEDILGSLFNTTEDGFLTLVCRSCGIKPLIANLGDSQALTRDHNASKDEVRQELRLLRHGDSHIVGAWHIKDIIQQAVKILSARKNDMSYDDLKKVERGIRPFFHDDITIVVIFKA
ncbi:hypothetical protein GQ457_02G025350 [Hibiscus cannabinus]